MVDTLSPNTDQEVVRRTEEAKVPSTVVAGPYGHPFHPILVAVPIGAWVASLVFDIASRVSERGSAALVSGAYWLVGLAIVGALLAAPLSDQAALAAVRSGGSSRCQIRRL